MKMDRLIFTGTLIKNHLKKMALLKADVTANRADDQELLKRFSIFEPPSIIFSTGKESTSKSLAFNRKNDS